jgi:thioredoxin-like negative regulator of GroEL
MSSTVRARPAIEALYATAYWLHEMGRYGDAACVFRSMMTAEPEDERGWLGLGTCHEALGQAHIALEVYAAAASVLDAPARCQLARARLLRSTGDAQGAAEALASAEAGARDTSDAELLGLVTVEWSAP